MNPILAVGNSIGTAREALFPFDAPVCGMSRLIGVLLKVNVNSGTTDYAVPLILLPGCNFVINKLMLNNASTSLTTATAGVFTATGGGGIALAADQVLSGLTTTTSNLNLTLAAGATTNVLNQTTQANTLYFRCGTAQGAAATVDVYLFADVLP
jgi:hypothetical protein